MANKKRMEQDPSIDPKTGKKRERKLKADKPGITIKVDGVPLGDFHKRISDMASKIAGAYTFDARQVEDFKQSFGGNIFVEGGDGRMRSWLGDMAKDPAIQKTLRDVLGMGERLEDKDSVARLIWSKAIEVWESPLNWQFMVVHNPGQETYWFTAKYYDEEAETIIVEMTQEFTAEQLAAESYDSINVGVERALEDMHRKCEAEIAMFE